MKAESIRSLSSGFEEKAHKQEDLEFWYARDLSVIPAQAGSQATDHFVDVNNMVG